MPHYGLTDDSPNVLCGFYLRNRLNEGENKRVCCRHKTRIVLSSGFEKIFNFLRGSLLEELTDNNKTKILYYLKEVYLTNLFSVVVLASLI